MKRGSKSIRCDMCGKIIGWTIPTGQTDYGIKRVEIVKNDDCNEFFIGFCQHFLCDGCVKEGGR